MTDKDTASNSFKDLTALEKENRMLKILGVVYKTRFTWKRSHIKILKERLRVVGLQLDIFKEGFILFGKLKYRLGRKIQVGEFYKYHTLVGLINQNDFRWQINTIWEMLFNTKPGEECYALLESLLQTKNVVRDK